MRCCSNPGLPAILAFFLSVPETYYPLSIADDYLSQKKLTTELFGFMGEMGLNTTLNSFVRNTILCCAGNTRIGGALNEFIIVIKKTLVTRKGGCLARDVRLRCFCLLGCLLSW